tara:strand:+ start:1767 stop:1943 length:177 start_codon:yes stop_codon:yes gene_type:complete
MKTIKLTQEQLSMLREAWMEYFPDFMEEADFRDQVEKEEDKRKIKIYETLKKKLWEKI